MYKFVNEFGAIATNTKICDSNGENDMQVKNKGNTVSDKSKLWMEKALTKLLKTESFQKITIKEITDKAGLSRRTFYRNYSSKEEIIKGLIAKILLEYRSLIGRQADLSLAGVSKTIFTLAQKHKDFLLMLNRNRLIPILMEEIDGFLPPLFEMVKGHRIDCPEESVQYALTFGAGGFVRILMRWLDEGGNKPPEKMMLIMDDIVKICNYPQLIND